MRVGLMMAIIGLCGCISVDNGSSTDGGTSMEDALDDFGGLGEFGGFGEVGGIDALDSENLTDDDVMVPIEQSLKACAEGIEDSEVADTLKIVDAFENSVHEMVACGQLTFILINTLIDVVISLATDPGSSKLPDGFGFDEESKSYTAQANTFGRTVMRIQFFDENTSDVETQSGLIQHDVFRADSYLVRANAKLNLRNQKIEISYQKPGPLVALLGFGDNPPNPLVIGVNDVEKLARGVNGLKFQMTVEFDDESEDGTVTTYLVNSPLAIVRAALSSALLDANLVNAAAERVSLDQSLSVSEWRLAYDDGVGALNGQIEFAVGEKYFPFVGVFTYEQSARAAIELTCQ